MLAVGATSGGKLFEGIVLTTRYFFDAWGCEYRGGLFSGVLTKKELLENARVFRRD